MSVPAREKIAVLAMKGWPSRFRACSTTGWRPASMAKPSEDHLGQHVIIVDREFRQRGRDIEQREGMRGGAQIVAGFERVSA